MTNLFQKLNEVPKFFSKIYNDSNLFRKINNTARKVDNSVARVGNFLVNTANNVGLGRFAPAITDVVDRVHKVRNGLEKAITAPIGEVRHEIYQ